MARLPTQLQLVPANRGTRLIPVQGTAQAIDAHRRCFQPILHEIEQWSPIENEAVVREMIRVIQSTIISELLTLEIDGQSVIHGSDLANVLLATVLEPYPVCATPAGMRRIAEAAGKELHQLMRDTRRVKTGDGSA